MISNGFILKICQVVSINDETDGERIKVRLNPEDNRKKDEDLPFAYPLLPKLIHVKPKVGEAVLVFLTQVDNGESNRYYIGPIISQPQHMHNEDFGISSLSLHPGSRKGPDVAPSTNISSHGSLSKPDDIALYGRLKNDIILTDDDVRIRCGARLKNNGISGGLQFNTIDPAYIHLKHSDNTRGVENDKDTDNLDAYRSTATIVADKINLISHRSQEPFRVTDNNHLISDDEMQNIIDKAHELPYGDVLVSFLKMFVNAFALHTHPYPGMQPCATQEYIDTVNYDLNKILSSSVRIN